MMSTLSQLNPIAPRGDALSAVQWTGGKIERCPPWLSDAIVTGPREKNGIFRLGDLVHVFDGPSLADIAHPGDTLAFDGEQITVVRTSLSLFQRWAFARPAVKDVLAACRVAQKAASRFNGFSVWRSVDRLWLDIEDWQKKGGEAYGRTGARWSTWAGFAEQKNWHWRRHDPFIRLTELGNRLADDLLIIRQQRS